MLSRAIRPMRFLGIFCAVLALIVSTSFLFRAEAASITSTASGNWSGAATSAWPLTNRTGNVTSSNVSAAVTGTGTAFLTELTIGNVISTQAGTAIGTVLLITDNTHLTLTGNATNSVTGQTYRSNGVGPGDSATIASAHTVTMDVTNATISALTLASPTAANGLSISTDKTLTITNALTFTANATINAQTITLNGTANLNAASILGNAPTSTGASKIICAAAANGTVNISGNITLTGNSTASSQGQSIDFAANSTACNLTAGSITLNAGTVSGGAIKMGTGLFTLNGTSTFGAALGVLSTQANGAISLNNGVLGTGGTITIGAGTSLTSVGVSSVTYATAITTWGGLNVSSGKFMNTSAAATFTSMTVAAGAILDGGTRLLTSSGNYTNNGTHLGSGGMTVMGSNAVLNGTGTYNNTGTLTLSSSNKSFASTANLTIKGTLALSGALIFTNNGTVTITSAGGLTGSVAGSTWVNNPGSVLNISGPVLVTGVLNSSSSANTVNYNGAAQTVKGATYDNLTLSGSGADVITAVSTINSDFTMSGAAMTATTGAAMTIGGNMNINSGSTFTTGATNTWTLAVTGTTSVGGTLTLNNTGSKTFTGNVTVNSGGAMTVAAGATIAFANGLTNNSGGTLTIAAPATFSTNDQIIDGTNAISFSGAVTAGTAGKTVTNNNDGTLTIAGTLTLTGNWTQGANSTLLLTAGTSGAGTFDGSANPNTVTYTGNGATVFCSAPGYYDLLLKPSGASAQVLCSGAGATLNVANNLTIGDGTNAGATGATNNPTINVSGDLTLATKATFTDTSGVTTVSGAINNSGNLSFKGSEQITPAPTNLAGSTVTYTATTGTVPILSTWTYANLIFNGAGGTFSTSNALTVSENFTKTAGTLSMTGSTLTFTGSAAGQRIDPQGSTFGVIIDSNPSSGGIVFASNFSATTLYVNGAGLGSGTTIYFTASALYTIGTLQLTGSNGSNVSLHSTIGGTPWLLNNTGSNDVSFVDVKDSDAHQGLTIEASDGTSDDMLNNTNWHFVTTCGAVSSTKTGNWSDSSVWNLGFVPSACNPVTVASAHTVTVDGADAALSLTLASAVAANGVTISNGNTLTVTNALTFTTNGGANPQTITMQGTGNLNAGSIVTSASTGIGASIITCAAGATGTVNVSGDIALVGSSFASSNGAKIDFGTNPTGCNVTAGTVHLTGSTVSAGLLKLSTGTLTLNGALTGAGTAARAQLTTSGAATIVLNGGSLGTGGTLSIAAGTDLTSTGASSVPYATSITTWGDLTINNGTLTYSGAVGTFASITIAAGAILSPGAFLLTNSGNYTNNGTHLGSGGMTMTGVNAVLDGTGTYNNSGTLTLNTANKSFAPTANLTINGTLACVGAFSFTNNGTVMVTAIGGVTASVAGTTWINNANSVLKSSGPVVGTGVLISTTSPNTVEYNGAAQTVKAATYDHLTLNGSGAKTVTGVTTVNSDFTMGNTATATSVLTTIGGDFNMSGTAALILGANLTVAGNFNVTAGTVTTGNFTFGVTGPSSIGGAFTHSGNAAVTFNNNFTVNGTMSGGGTGTITAKGDVTGTGIITLSGGTFEQRVTADSNFGQTSGANNWTFKNLTFSNSNGGATPIKIVSQTGGSGSIIATTLLTVGKVGDTAGATTTLDPGDLTWTLSGVGTVFTLTANLGVLCDPVTCPTNTSTIQFTGATATLMPASLGYYNLIRSPTIAGTVTDTVTGGAITVYNNFTMNPTKTVATSSLTVVLGGNLTVLNGTLTLTGTTFGASELNTNPTNNYSVTANAITIAQGPGSGATDDLKANNSIITITGTGTPFTIGASLATFTRGSGTVNYTGNGATITVLTGTGATNTYFNLGLKPNGSSQQVIGSGTLDVNGDLTIGDGTNTGATASGNPSINLYGNLVLAANTVYTKGSGTTTFKKGSAQTWTDNSTGQQDLGTVRVSVNGTNTTVNLGSAVEATDLTIDASQVVSLNGTNTLMLSTLSNAGTLTGSTGGIILSGTGTPFTNSGTYTYNSSSFTYTGNGAVITAQSGSAGTNGYYNLFLQPDGASAQVLGTAGGQTFQINKNLTIGDGTHAGATGATNNPIITVVKNVAISPSATFTATTGAFSVGGSWANAGSFSANSSTVTFNGTTSGQTIASNASSFANLQITGAGGFWTLSDPLTVVSTLTLTNGTLDTGSNNAITLGGGWAQAATATFNSNASTVTFNGAAAQKINSTGEVFAYLVDANVTAGGLIFSSSFTATGFTINSVSLASPTTVYFNAGSTFTITNIAWTGSAANKITLRSITNNLAWTLINTSTNAVTYVDVRDSDAHNGQTMIGGPKSINSGNNTNWTFLILGVDFSPASYGFGSVNMGATTVSTSAIVATNTGNDTETYSMSVSTTVGTAWMVATSTPTTLDHFAIFGLFNTVQASSSTFQIQDIMLETPTPASGSVYAGNQTAVSVPVGSTRNFWMRLDMPPTTTSTSTMGINVTITASSP